MDVHFIAPELKHLDELKCEALAAPFFEDERPLTGTLGRIDWRMCGMISRLLLSGRIQGKRQETVLIPARPRLSFEKLLLFGLGPAKDFDDTVLKECVGHMLRTLDDACVRSSAFVLPGSSLPRVDPMRSMETFLRLLAAHPDQDEVTLVEPANRQRAMAPVVQREKRKARALHV